MISHKTARRIYYPPWFLRTFYRLYNRKGGDTMMTISYIFAGLFLAIVVGGVILVEIENRKNRED